VLSSLRVAALGLTRWFPSRVRLARLTGARQWERRLFLESYDALTHSLSAQVVCLEGARLLLLHNGAGEDALRQVSKAGELARAGLADLTYAMELAGSADASIRELLAWLAEDFTARTGARCPVTVVGDPEQLPGEHRLAVLRCAGETLRVIERCVPGADAEIAVLRDPAHCELTVSATFDPRAGIGAQASSLLAVTNRLVRMRERVALVGGLATVAPSGRGFALRIGFPA
jgi:signal transduction histidine kinase